MRQAYPSSCVIYRGNGYTFRGTAIGLKCTVYNGEAWGITIGHCEMHGLWTNGVYCMGWGKIANGER